MRVRLTRAAQTDLDLIGQWIAQDNPVRALSFIDELTNRCRSLSTNADRFPIAYDLGGRTVRKMRYGRYLVFYYELNGAIEVSRIVHGARDWSQMFEV